MRLNHSYLKNNSNLVSCLVIYLSYNIIYKVISMIEKKYIRNIDDENIIKIDGHIVNIYKRLDKLEEENKE